MTLRGADRKVQRLSTIPLFGGCTDREMVELARIFEMSDVRTGQVLQQEKSVSRWWQMITKGAAHATRKGTHIGALAPGDFFGERGILGRQSADTTITTVAPTTVLVLDGRRLLGLIDGFPLVGKRIVSALALRPTQYGNDWLWTRSTMTGSPPLWPR